MPSRRAACAARSFRAAAMTACSQLCRSATDVRSVISFPAACGSLDREDSLKDGNLHRISSPRSCGASSEESETSPARPNMHASRPRPTGPPRHQKFLSPFRQNATADALRVRAGGGAATPGWLRLQPRLRRRRGVGASRRLVVHASVASHSGVASRTVVANIQECPSGSTAWYLRSP